MKTLHFVVLTFLVAFVTACGSITPKTPAQAVYVVEGEYNVALQAAVDYKNLPPCATGITVVCSDPAIVKKLQDADKTASAALANAETIALSPTAAKTDVDKALAIANAAITVLTQIEASLKTK